MRPYSDIHEMDVYKNPMTGSEWVVLAKNDAEKMVQIQMLSNHLPERLNQPIWKRNTDHIFGYRKVQDGSTLGISRKVDSTVSCPFCGEADFDLIGLRRHLDDHV